MAHRLVVALLAAGFGLCSTRCLATELADRLETTPDSLTQAGT